LDINEVNEMIEIDEMDILEEGWKEVASAAAIGAGLGAYKWGGLPGALGGALVGAGTDIVAGKVFGRDKQGSSLQTAMIPTQALFIIPTLVSNSVPERYVPLIAKLVERNIIINYRNVLLKALSQYVDNKIKKEYTLGENVNAYIKKHSDKYVDLLLGRPATKETMDTIKKGINSPPDVDRQEIEKLIQKYHKEYTKNTKVLSNLNDVKQMKKELNKKKIEVAERLQYLRDTKQNMNPDWVKNFKKETQEESEELDKLNMKYDDIQKRNVNDIAIVDAELNIQKGRVANAETDMKRNKGDSWYFEQLQDAKSRLASLEKQRADLDVELKNDVAQINYRRNFLNSKMNDSITKFTGNKDDTITKLNAEIKELNDKIEQDKTNFHSGLMEYIENKLHMRTKDALEKEKKRLEQKEKIDTMRSALTIGNIGGMEYVDLKKVELPKSVEFYKDISLEPTFLEVPIGGRHVKDKYVPEQTIFLGFKSTPVKFEGVENLVQVMMKFGQRGVLNAIRRVIRNIGIKILTSIRFTRSYFINKGRPEEGKGSKTLGKLFARDLGGAPVMDLSYTPNFKQILNPKFLSERLSGGLQASYWASLLIITTQDIQDSGFTPIQFYQNYRRIAKSGWGDIVIIDTNKESINYCSLSLLSCSQVPFAYISNIMNIDNVLDFSELNKFSKGGPFNMIPSSSFLKNL